MAERCLAAHGTHCTVPADDLALRDSAAVAFARGWMPLRSTGVDRFAASHPDADGRGVVIAILDSGIDPGVPGLTRTTDDRAKILDLRDFSGEGRIALTPVRRRGDTLWVGGHALLGAAHVASLTTDSTIWGGTLDEPALGKPPSADVNGNGVASDTLPIVMIHGAHGWAMLIDADGEGSFADSDPIYDYAVDHQYFSWHPRASGTLDRLPSPLDFAANITDSSATPTLDLFFDTSSHGTHVSGIAAGHNIYGVPGFDGVAPGAQLLGLKIANDAHGAVTVTGSMVRALDYAIHFAESRRLPLVVNMSFGVGNQIPGAARIDRLIDSVLDAHPDVVMTIAAGNDGPGIGTIGFPGSAARAISVGATLPLAFVAPDAGSALAEPIAIFSGRGGALAAPDIVTPGAAYSTVPVYARGNELENGTSMASPHAAGLVARLVSAAVAQGKRFNAAEIRQALRFSAHLLPSGSAVDQGAGLPDLPIAWDWLTHPHFAPAIDVNGGNVVGRSGVLVTAVAGGARPLTASLAFERIDSVAPVTLALHADAAWLKVPASVVLHDGRANVTVTVSPTAFRVQGVSIATITVMGPDTTAGALAIIPVTVRTPVGAEGTSAPMVLARPADAVGRVFIAADTGRGMQIRVAAAQSTDHVTAALTEPGGMPFRDGPMIPAGSGDAAGTFDIGANDVVKGVYELDMVSDPVAPSAANVTVAMSPLRLGATFDHDTLAVNARNLSAHELSVRLRAGLVGAERDTAMTRRGDGLVTIRVAVPKWATNIIVDARMPATQWARFTDFGVTLQQRDGRQIDVSPLNYAFGRMAADVPDRVAGDSLDVVLSPGFAAVDTLPWAIALSIRFYVGKPYALDGGGSHVAPLAAGAIREARFAEGAAPVTIPGGFAPLITVVGLEGDDGIWTREMALPSWTPTP